MMWKRSIVQATSGGRRAAALALVLASLAWVWRGASCADLVIEIPGSGAAEAEGGQYRLDYRPPRGSPAPNFTVPARASTINFQGLPGTKYHFMLYYSNATFADLLTWNQTIITAPEPPTNLTVALGRNKQATIAWSPPAHGDYTGFRFKVIALTERAEVAERNISVEGGGGAANWTHALRELAPGATYQLHAFTLLHDKESAAYASRNFTTKPNTPGKFIVWFRNETTLLVLWQPPYPPGFYTHYKVSIVPPDARDSELYVEKEGEPPGPAQAAFKGLVPGRAYNISVQTVSEPEISAPTTAQYRTVPLRPRNVTAPLHSLAETSFRVAWLPPQDESEFEKYQVSVSGESRRLAPVVRARSDPPYCSFDALEPGAHYTVTVKTMSGKVTSWPAATELTLKPLPVVGVTSRAAGEGALQVHWRAANASVQDEFRLEYHEAGPSEDSSALTVPAPAPAPASAPAPDTDLALEGLLPGRNYTVSVMAVSRGVRSNATTTWAATRPLAPVVVTATSQARDLALAWRSDVNSRQHDYWLRYRRRKPKGAEDEYHSLTTAETSAVLEGLFPGAVYELQLAARSHGLLSENHTLYKPVRPLPALSLSVSRTTSNSAGVEWVGPSRTAGALGAYSLRYKTERAAAWSTLPPFDAATTRAEISNMTHGERYIIELDTLSEAADDGESVPSGAPRLALHTVRPNPVSNVAQLVDTRNLTLEWPRGGGRVDDYELRIWPRDPEEGAAAEARSLSVQAPAAGSTARVLLGGLEPGLGYSISIAAHSYNLTSDLFTMDTRTRPLIQSEMTIVNEADNGEGDDNNETLPSILVTYTPTPASASRFDAYRFRLEAGEPIPAEAGDTGPQQAARAAQGGEPRRVLFPRLVPGALYNITMWTLSHNVTSHPVQRQARLYPRAVPWVNATRVSARSVSLEWARPTGVYTEFEVQYLAAKDTLQTHTTPAREITINELRPHTLYTFTVVVRSGAAGALRTVSRAVSARVGTAQAAPPAPRDFRPLDATPSRISFQWELPVADANGDLTRFLLDYWPMNEPDNVKTIEFPPEARTGAVPGLSPGGTYSFVLRAETVGGAGAAARWTQHMAIGAPPRPPPSALPAPAAASPTTVAVRFRSDYFSPANGNVTAYTLVVTEDPSPPPALQTTPAGRMPSWRDVQRLPAWPPYQVTDPYYPFRASAVEEFTIGSERCDAAARRYCNGPLKPATKYYVKLRAFTAPDKFTDTQYIIVHTEVDNTGWIIGVCVGVAGLACGLGAALVLRRRRGVRAGAAAAAPAPRTSRPVRVADFLDHYRLMAADSDFRFSEEFEELKHVGRDQPTTAADLPVNRPKNRFTNILPYDHSRYKLRPVDDEEGSDYINANYVPGHASPREFIVTQGPLHSTRDDFWRMCWESGARGIVMLTRCVEKGREKCDRYWPYDTRPVYYGDIAVTALNESRYPDWTVTELMLSRGSEQRVVKHFHFTTWPDFGVPEPPETLARFVRAFRERCPPDARPVVVHCSAGVGRSGTFITLDTALQQLARGADALDVFGMVHAMRRERVWMVQTEQQYICIHQCLVAVLEGQDLAPPQHNHHLNPAFEDDEGIVESGM